MNNGYNRNNGNRNGQQMPRHGQQQGGTNRPVQRPMQGQAPRQGQTRQNPMQDPRMRQQGQQYRQPQRRPVQNQQAQAPGPRPQNGQPRLERENQFYSDDRQARSRSVSSTRRKATREQMRQERRSRRREAGKIFLSRLATYGVMVLVLGAIVAGVFFWSFYSTPDANETQITYFENYNGNQTVKNKVSGDAAYQNGILYVNFSNIAEGCGMSVVSDSKNAKFVLPDGGDTSDSAGTGHEEYVSFTKDMTECYVCGQDTRLSSPALFSGRNVWIPADFVTGYVNGITITEEKAEGKVYVMRDKTSEADDAPLAEVSFKLKAVTAPEPAEPMDDLVVGGEMPEVTFSTDLSEYEQYMKPADATEYLVLVNKTNTVNEDYAPDNLTDVADTRKDGRDTQQMQLVAAKALEAMFIELRAAGFTDVSVTSAYRSYKNQNELYTTYTNNEMANNPALTKEQAQAIVDTYSAKPGTSEHQTGLCCDLHNLSGADKAFANEPAYDWLCENAWKFGFILRFPEDKTEVTGYDFEPWHYRFVGRDAAWAIHNAGMCLEEYKTN